MGLFNSIMKPNENEGTYQFTKRFIEYLENVQKEIEEFLESSDMGYSEKRRIRRLYWFLDMVISLENERHK